IGACDGPGRHAGSWGNSHVAVAGGINHGRLGKANIAVTIRLSFLLPTRARSTDRPFKANVAVGSGSHLVRKVQSDHSLVFHNAYITLTSLQTLLFASDIHFDICLLIGTLRPRPRNWYLGRR